MVIRMLFSGSIYDVFFKLAVLFKFLSLFFSNYSSLRIFFDAFFLISFLLVVFLFVQRGVVGGGRLFLLLFFLIFSFCHLLFFSDDLKFGLFFYFGVLQFFLFFMFARDVGYQIICQIFYLISFFATVKLVVFSLGVFLVYFFGLNVQSQIATLLLGDIITITPSSTLMGKYRFFDSSSVLIYLSLYYIFNLGFLRWLFFLILVFYTVVNLTVGVFLPLLLGLCFVFLRKRLMVFAPVVFLLLLFVFFDGVVNLFYEKSYSFYVKLDQLYYAWDVFLANPLGIGVGTVVEGLFRPGDLIFENSYLYMLVAFGLFSVIPVVWLLYYFYFCYKVSLKYDSLNVYLIFCVVLIVLLFSASNPVFFSGTVYFFVVLSYSYYQNLYKVEVVT